jgi:hypothetical protein
MGLLDAVIGKYFRDEKVGPGRRFCWRSPQSAISWECLFPHNHICGHRIAEVSIHRFISDGARYLRQPLHNQMCRGRVNGMRMRVVAKNSRPVER